jgi:hypothetical protein
MMLGMNHSTSQRSWRQNLARGGASVASGTLGNDPNSCPARFSGRKNLSPAKAGSEIFLATVPRAALRSTSFRFACPGLNSAAGYAGSLSLVLLSLTIACSRTEPAKNPGVATQSPAATVENYPNLVTQAKEMNDAFARKDYGRFADLTYPKVIEMAGGRDQMLKGIAQQLNEMAAEGVVILSSTTGSPTQFVHDSGSIYAVLPTALKAKAKDGVFQSEGSMIGVSTDGGTNWRFIDSSGKDHRELKTILGNIVDRLNLPPDKQPVKISNGD